MLCECEPGKRPTRRFASNGAFREQPATGAVYPCSVLQCAVVWQAGRRKLIVSEKRRGRVASVMARGWPMCATVVCHSVETA